MATYSSDLTCAEEGYVEDKRLTDTNSLPTDKSILRIATIPGRSLRPWWIYSLHLSLMTLTKKYRSLEATLILHFSPLLVAFSLTIFIIL